MVFDGVIDGGGGEQGIELAPGGGGIVLGKDGLDDGAFGDGFAGLGQCFACFLLGLEVIDVELEDVLILDGVGDGVGVEFLLEKIRSGLVGGLLPLDLERAGVLLKDGRAGEAEELGLGEKLFDGLVVLSELGAVALVKNEDDALIPERHQLLLVVPFVGAIQGDAELLDGGDDDLVGVVIGEEAADEGGGVGVFLHAAFLEFVELLARLAVEILAIHDEEAFLDIWVVLQERGGFKGGEGLAAAGGAPDVAVAAVLIDAVHDLLHLIDLVRAHDHELLLASDEHHVAADHAAERAFHEEGIGKVIKVGDLLVFFIGKLVDGQETLVGIEGEVAGVVVGEVVGAIAIADDEELEETEQGLGVAVAGIVLIRDDLLHGAARHDVECLQLHLHDGHAIDEEDDIVAVMAVVGVDAELADDLEAVFAPVLDVDEGVVQRRAILAGEAVALAQDAGGGEDIRGDDFLKQAGELAIGEVYAVEGFEFLAEIPLQGSAVSDVRAVGVFQIHQLSDEAVFEVALLE